MRIRWLRTALRNLDEEASYIASDDPVAAGKVVDRVLTSVASLADHPAVGRPGRISGTRELVVPGTRYLVPYRVVGDQIQILRAFHTSRRPPASW
ncbi:type II toxin-antitoxin system RelE/ParE family toxin [Thauera sp. 2A1]|uniref:type II toxin-antitoxin system RelE/ParE family toxin n=1 Tax=Thauera sp. 2A1 TaxID=2570191 RepID=UPI001290B1D2|nr:type II toxin-antitoxin system RelE/ParE family toxin [Thauera sp. 2A1]KAI5913125.1 type II toxin-antitoxin system RelE/ParE family toxin [Thauera sp. 2A1]